MGLQKGKDYVPAGFFFFEQKLFLSIWVDLYFGKLENTKKQREEKSIFLSLQDNIYC